MKETIGQQIRALREHRGLAQVELASLCGVREVSVSRWERDLEIPRVPNLIALARSLGCTVMLGAGGARLIEVEKREPALQPLRKAVSRMKTLGSLALTQFVSEAVELADRIAATATLVGVDRR